jgi:mono/diheme cytochrome c family protein
MINTFSKVHLKITGKTILLLTFLFSIQIASAQADGEKLFKGNCARCHNVGEAKLVGPGLKGVRQRWSSEDNLIAWISNSADYLKTGDKYAVELYEKYNKAAMPAFTNLGKDEIVSILDYVDAAANAVAPADSSAAAGAGGGASAAKDDGNTLLYVLIAVIVVLCVLVYSLFSISQSLIQVIKTKDPHAEVDEEKSFLDASESALKNAGKWASNNKKVVAFISIIIVCIVLKFVWDGLLTIGVFQGYQPHQPIKFSHKLHAGENGIACVYCHTGATQSKHATIPSPSTCMNCHKAIKEGPTYGKAEISKIYASIGFDPNKDTYISDYEGKSFDEVSKIFEEWMGDKGSDYKNVEKYIQKPVDWVQVHKLPDHAYFNHAQHYNVAGIECQTCHGKVEEMEEVYQFAPLTMGWCINCHRETKVQWETNPYYDKLHEYLSKRYREGDQFTISRVGGLECGKCHY